MAKQEELFSNLESGTENRDWNEWKPAELFIKQLFFPPTIVLCPWHESKMSQGSLVRPHVNAGYWAAAAADRLCG